MTRNRRFLVGLVCIAGAAATVLALGGFRITGASPKALAAARLDRTPSELARELGGTASAAPAAYVKVPLNILARPYEEAALRWSAPGADHPVRACLLGRGVSNGDPRIATALAKRLHGGVDEKGEWRWNGSKVEMSAASICISVVPDYHGRPPDVWRRQLEAGWQVVLDAAFGVPPRFSSTELADLTGTGYPLQSLAEIETRLRADEGVAAVQKKYPGAETEDASSSLTIVEIVVDHPLFRTARLWWQTGLGLSRLSFRAMPNFSTNRATFIACMSKAMGASREYDGAVGRYVGLLGDIKDSNFEIALQDSDTEPVTLSTINAMIDPALWRRAIAALGQCRG